MGSCYSRLLMDSSNVTMVFVAREGGRGLVMAGEAVAPAAWHVCCGES